VDWRAGLPLRVMFALIDPSSEFVLSPAGFATQRWGRDLSLISVKGK
jgi:hypothetical protein